MMEIYDQEKHIYHQYFARSWFIDALKGLAEYCNEEIIPEWEAEDKLLHDIQYLEQLIDDKQWVSAMKKQYRFYSYVDRD